MTLEILLLLGLVFVATALGVSVGLSLVGAALVGGALTLNAGQLSGFLGSSAVDGLSSYAGLAAVLLIVAGALFAHAGAVLDLPACVGAGQAPSRLDPDRAGYFAGGALGVPLPVAASIVFIGLVSETSIGRLTMSALLPGLVLSALYLLVFGLSRLVRPARAEPDAEAAPRSGGDVFAVVVRCILPVLGALVFVAPVQTGVMTPTEAAAFVVLVGLVFTFALVLASRRARAGAWAGLCAGAAGAAIFLLILLGLLLFGRILALGQVPQGIATAVAPLGLDPRGLLGLAAVATLFGGMIVGPLAAVGLALILFFATLTGAGVDPLVFGTVLFLVAEAIRVGPRLWRGGFLRSAGGLGGWPNYLSALAVTAGFVLLVA